MLVHNGRLLMYISKAVTLHLDTWIISVKIERADFSDGLPVRRPSGFNALCFGGGKNGS